MNHKWKNDMCVNCGITRTMKSWKLLMAIDHGRDYYKYGRSWFYGNPHPEHANTVKAIGFKRPECKKLNP